MQLAGHTAVWAVLLLATGQHSRDQQEVCRCCAGALLVLAGQALAGQGRITTMQAELVAVRQQLARLERRERRVEREVGRHRRQVDLASRPEVVKSVISLS